MATNDFNIPYGQVRDRKTVAILKGYFKRRLFAYDASDLVEYIGYHYMPGAATDLSDWEIHRFSYTGNLVTDIQILPGAWDDRATLDWV